ncbi:hypothetical protein FGO68_gene11676 [Halteria grandinella]|uniref:Uncharacterized protein n=1 Tax=Halteria grandinella TaxID=5974 RepID=A0A8J8P2W3_HALGN|nr:hypothetical protein FGO68_gene11676 [Halteria grandinella]
MGRHQGSLRELKKDVDIKVPENMIVELFHARCEDLKLPQDSRPKHMLEGFARNIESCIRGRVVNLKNAQFGPRSALIIKKILLHCREYFSQLLLGDNDLQDSGISELCEVIKANKSLIKVDLSCNGLTSKCSQGMYEALLKNVSIIDLDLSSKGGKQRNTLQSDGCQGLTKLLSTNPFLSFLNLSGNSIGNEGVKCIALAFKEPNTISALQSLDLSDNDITARGSPFLRDILMQSPLLELSIRGNFIGDNGCLKICEALRGDRTKVKRLDVSNCKIGYLGILKLLDSVKANYSIQALTLNRNMNDLSVKPSFRSVMTLISQNHFLVELNFRQSGLGDVFAIALGEGLRNCQKLQRLDLSTNKIADAGAVAIADGLIHRFSNSTLKSLNLSQNRIGDEGGKQLALMLQVNKSLNYLNLCNNTLTEGSGECVVTAMSKNESIIELGVEYNLLSHSQLKTIRGFVQRNQEIHKSTALQIPQSKVDTLKLVRTEIKSVYNALLDHEKQSLVEHYHKDQLLSQQNRLLSERKNKFSDIESEAKKIEARYNQVMKESQISQDKQVSLREVEIARERVEQVAKANTEAAQEIQGMQNKVKERKAEIQKLKQALYKQLLDSELKAKQQESVYKELKVEKHKLLTQKQPKPQPLKAKQPEEQKVEVPVKKSYFNVQPLTNKVVVVKQPILKERQSAIKTVLMSGDMGERVYLTEGGKSLM